ncbi:MAG: hypothetical protein QM669_14505 [Siphonobacter sp.]
MDDFAVFLSGNDVLILTAEQYTGKETKFYLSSIIDMSDFVNNLPTTFFEYKNRIVLYYTGFEKYLNPKIDTSLHAKMVSLLEQNLNKEGTDARTDHSPIIYDVPVWELTVMPDGSISKEISEKGFPNWSNWSDRHPVKK